MDHFNTYNKIQRALKNLSDYEKEELSVAADCRTAGPILSPTKLKQHAMTNPAGSTGYRKLKNNYLTQVGGKKPAT